MKLCKILFIYPDINEVDSGFKDNKGSYYYGVAQLSSVLKQSGAEVGLLHYTETPSRESFLKDINNFSPDIIGFSATTTTMGYIRQWASWLREAEVKVPIILGGSHATLDNLQEAKNSLFDVIFVGESEESLLEYCRRFRERPTNISGTLAKDVNGNYVENPVRPLERNLDKYPFPDWDLFDYENLYDMKTHKRGILMASRGCPFKCGFCSNDRYAEIFTDNWRFVRLNSVDYVIAQAKEMKNKYPGINYFQFADDVLGANYEWLKEFSEKWPKEIGMDFYGNINVNVCREDTIKLLSNSGCRRLQIGIETGDERRRLEILNKPVPNSVITRVVKECRKYGIEVVSLNMIGLPFETEENILQTIKFNAQLGIKFMQCTIFFPFPHTYLHDYCAENNLFTKDDQFLVDYFRDSVLKNPFLSRDALYFFRDYFKMLVKIYQYVNIDCLLDFLGYHLAGKILKLFKTKNELKKWLYRPKNRVTN